MSPPLKIVCHSKAVLKIAKRFGWLPGARYTNLRDIRSFSYIGLIDIDWKNYKFNKHLSAVKQTRPKYTVAQDIEDIRRLPEIIEQAFELKRHCENVIIVPKTRALRSCLDEKIPNDFLIGYSVPTKYGGTKIPLRSFKNRRIHLLGGRPDVQRALADSLHVVSLDTNRFTYDAAFGDFFDGTKFKPHPVGGYETCIRESLKNTNRLWEDYAL